MIIMKIAKKFARTGIWTQNFLLLSHTCKVNRLFRKRN